ncbi:MAG TPA: cytosine permease [Pseudonocardia sp.]|jgi:purine-cytosine permease-like protein|nr:cytosine permease [Pseudonocardia sp.]
MDTDNNSPAPAPTLRIESHSIDYVPLRERHGKAWHLWPVWFTGDAHLATVATGVLGITMGANLLWTAIAILTGCAFGTFFMAFHSSQGPQLGLPQMIQSRPQFGYLGALLVWVVALVTYVGYNAFNQLLAGQAAHLLIGVGPTGAYLVFTVIALALAIFGYDWIHKAQRWLAYALLAVLVIFSLGIGFTGELPPGQFNLSGFHAVAFLTQFFVAAAYQLSWAIYVSDYSRYLPKTVGVRATFWWTYLGALIGGTWMMLVGAMAAALNAKLDVSEVLLRAGDTIFPGFGTILIVVALLGLITVTGLNFYGGSLTLLSIADSIRPIRHTRTERLLSLLFCAVVATFIALRASGDFLHEFEGFLGVLLLLFTPWTAINLVDFFWVRHTHYSIREIFNPHGIYGRWGWRGLLAYLLGFLAMLPFAETELFTGPIGAELGVDIGMIPGLIISAGAYLLFCRNIDLDAERAVIARADADLDRAPGSEVRPEPAT